MVVFNGLLDEVLDRILDACDFVSLKHLRLVSKDWSTVVTPRIFEQCYLGFFTSHLENLVAVSNRPDLAKHVKELFIVPNIAPYFPSLPEWRACVLRTRVPEPKALYYLHEHGV